MRKVLKKYFIIFLFSIVLVSTSLTNFSIASPLEPANSSGDEYIYEKVFIGDVLWIFVYKDGKLDQIYPEALGPH